jgi:hypothetical protein
MAPALWGTLKPAATPTSISRRQFFQVLADREMITREEALAGMARGEIPEDFEILIQMIADDGLEWQARALIAGATDFDRANGFVEFIAAFKGMNAVDMDQLWRDGALT